MNTEKSKRAAYKNCDLVTFEAKAGVLPAPTTIPGAMDAAASSVGAYGAAYDVNVASGLSATPNGVTQAQVNDFMTLVWKSHASVSIGY